MSLAQIPALIQTINGLFQQFKPATGAASTDPIATLINQTLANIGKQAQPTLSPDQHFDHGSSILSTIIATVLAVMPPPVV